MKNQKSKIGMLSLVAFLVFFTSSSAAFAQGYGRGAFGRNVASSAMQVRSIEDYYGPRGLKIVPVCPYRDSAAVAGRVPDFGDSSRTWMINRNRERFLQSEWITDLEIGIGDTAAVTGLYAEGWEQRTDSVLYGFDQRSVSENLWPAILAAIAVQGCSTMVRVHLETPIWMGEGWFYVIRLTKSVEGAAGSTRVLYSLRPEDPIGTSQDQPDSSNCYMVVGAPVQTEGFQWRNQRKLTNIIPVVFYGQSPYFIGEGNSIMGGYTQPFYGGYSFLPTIWADYRGTGKSFKLSIPYLLGHKMIPEKLGNDVFVPYQNRGWFGAGLATICERVVNEDVYLGQKIEIIEGGINSLAGAVPPMSLDSMIYYYRTMIDSCAVHGIYVAIVGVLPCNGYYVSIAGMRRADSLMTALRGLVAGKGRMIDLRPILGIKRDTIGVATTEGQYWNINPLYGGPLHYSYYGHQVIAQGIADSLFPTLPNPWQKYETTLWSDCTYTSKGRNHVIRQNTYAVSGEAGTVTAYDFRPNEAAMLESWCLDTLLSTDSLESAMLYGGFQSNPGIGFWLYLNVVKQPFVEAGASKTGAAGGKSRGWTFADSALTVPNPDGKRSSNAVCVGCSDTLIAGRDTLWLPDTSIFWMKLDSVYIPPSAGPVYFAINATKAVDSMRTAGYKTMVLHAGRIAWATARPNFYSRKNWPNSHGSTPRLTLEYWRKEIPVEPVGGAR